MMTRLKDIIRNISRLANDPNSTLETILNAIAEGVHDYFYHDDRDFGTTAMSYIVLYPHTPQQFRLPAVYPKRYRDPLNSALTEIMNAPEGSPRGINFEAYSSEEIQNVGNVHDPKYSHTFAPRKRSSLPNTHSHLSVPIVAYRRRPRPEFSLETIGVISIESDRPNAFNETDEQIIELLADYSAGIIDNKRIALSLEALQSSTQELAGALSLNTLDDICQRVTEMAVDILQSLHQDVAFCHVALLEQAGEDRILNFKAMYGDKEILKRTVGSNTLNLDHPPEDLNGKIGIVGRCVLENRTINLGDARNHEDYIVLDPHVRSQLAIPIKLEDAVLGAINVEYFEENAFDMNEQHIIESLAAAAAIAIQNVRMRVALQDISAASSLYTDIIDVLEVVMNKTTELVTFQHSETVNTTIGIVSKDGGVRYTKPLISSEAPNVTLKPNQGLSQHVIRTGKEVYRGNVKNDPDYVITNKGTASEFLAPVTVGASRKDPGSVMAIISIQSPIEHAFNEYTFQIVRLFAGQAAIAIRNHRLFRTLRKLHEISSRKEPDKTTYVDQPIDTKGMLADNTTLMLDAADDSVPFEDRPTEIINRDDDDKAFTEAQVFSIVGDRGRNLLTHATNEPQLAETIFRITEEVISFDQEIQFEAMLVTFLSEETNKAHLYDFTRMDETKEPEFREHELSELNIISKVIEQRGMVTSDHIYEASLREYQVYNSFIFVPMLLDNECYGVLSIFSHRKDAFNEDDEWMLQNVADRAAEAYSQFRRVRRLNQGVLALNEIDNRIIALLTKGTKAAEVDNGNPLEPIWDFIVKNAIKLTEADGGSIYMYDMGDSTLSLVQRHGKMLTEAKDSYQIDDEGFVETLAVREKRIVTHIDLNEAEFARLREQSLVAVPLIADDIIVGVLTVGSEQTNLFDNDRIDLLKALAGQAVVALRYSELVSRMGDLFSTNITLSHLGHEEAAQLILDKALEFVAPKQGLRGLIYNLNIATANLERVGTAGFEDTNNDHQRFLKRTNWLSLDSANGISEAAVERHLHYIEDVQNEAIYQDFYQDMPDIRSILSLAIYGSRETINGGNENPQVVRGVITVISSEPNAFTELDRRLMIYFANQIELAWLYVNQKRRMVELATVNQEWGQTSSEDADSRARWRNLEFWDKVERLIGAKSGSIKERHLGTGELHWADDYNVLASSGDLLSALEDTNPPDIPDDIHVQVVQTQKAINTPRINDEGSSIVLSEVESTLHIEPARSQLAVPMFDRFNVVRGVISVESPVAYAFDANDMRFLQVLANQAWSVMDSAQSQRNQWEAGILPTFFAMLHDHKNTLTGLRSLLLTNPDITGDEGDATNRLQRYVTLVEETQYAFNQLRGQEDTEVKPRPVGEILIQVREQFLNVYPDLKTDNGVQIDDRKIRDKRLCINYDTRLQHIFRNLLINAVKYGKTPIIIGAAPNYETKMVGLWVQDMGDGISEVNLSSIYEPQFERNTNNGWGLGLWFTKLFVQSMGGIIEKPEPADGQKGTRFRFWLPIADCAEE